MSDTKLGSTELVLPIVCPHCKAEVELGMVFSLLPPKESIKEKTNESKEEQAEGAQEEDEIFEEEE